MERALRRQPFDLATASSGTEALRALEREAFDAVVSDERMPEMSGSDLLVEVARRHPSTVRITLTGAGSLEAAQRAINEATIYRFLMKPIRPADLARTIIDGIDAREQSRVLAERIADDAERYIDAETGLYNENFLTDRLDQLLSRSGGDIRGFTVLLMGIDRLRLFGDELPRQLGDRIQDRCAQTLDIFTGSLDLVSTDLPSVADSVVARTAADEFAMVFEHSGPVSPERLARQLTSSLEIPFDAYGQRIYLASRYGVVASGRYTTGAQILRDARVALTIANKRSTGSIEVFDPTMRSEAQLQAELEADFRTALREEQLEIFYQPLMDAVNERVIGCEALIRWFHPKHGFIPPPKIIAIAEQNEMMCELSQWILRTSCRRQVTWRERGHRIKMSVNASPSEFGHPDFVSRIMSAIDESGMDPSDLQLEITEGVLIDHAEQAMAVIDKLRYAGVRLALDDFGTGYSSLSYLRSLRIDTLKIDKSFVDHVLTNKRDAALLEGIVDLAQRLDYDVIAEGVETEAQCAFLIDAGIREVQGYHFSKPLRIEDFEQYLFTAKAA